MLDYDLPHHRAKSFQVFDGSEYGAICPQNAFRKGRPQKEDCLFLKILVPANGQSSTNAGQARNNLIPIIYWPPGGGFTVSNNAYDMYKQSDVIVSRGVGHHFELHILKTGRPEVTPVSASGRVCYTPGQN